MEIKWLKIEEVKPYANNAKLHDKRQISNVAESIKQFGWQQPIVVDADGVIIVGHCRYSAAKKLKMKEVPCVVADSLTEEQVKKYRLLDNKTNESGWDMELLADDLFGLDFEGFDIGWGIIDEEEETEVVEDDFEVNVPEEPKSKLGQVYQLGRHRLMCGDSTKQEDVEKLMGGQKADMVFTDPPYGMNAVTKSGVLSKSYKTDIMNDNDNKAAIDAFTLCQKMFCNSKQVWWGANYYTECLPSSECWIVWDKHNGSSDQTDCELAWTNFRSVVRQFTMTSEKKNRVHPTQKPCKLFCEIIKKFDKNNAFQYIIDIFGGSGSTLIACEQLNRTCYMMELDPKYVDVIIDRWEQFTGKKAVLISE